MAAPPPHESAITPERHTISIFRACLNVYRARADFSSDTLAVLRSFVEDCERQAGNYTPTAIVADAESPRRWVRVRGLDGNLLDFPWPDRNSGLDAFPAEDSATVADEVVIDPVLAEVAHGRPIANLRPPSAPMAPGNPVYAGTGTPQGMPADGMARPARPGDPGYVSAMSPQHRAPRVGDGGTASF